MTLTSNFFSCIHYNVNTNYISCCLNNNKNDSQQCVTQIKYLKHKYKYKLFL